MIVGVHHVAVATTDIERLAQFYVVAFGMSIIKTGGWQADSRRHEQVTGVRGSAARCWMLQGPNLFLELFEYTRPVAAEPEGRELWVAGYTHFAVTVKDIEAEYTRLQQCGMTFHGPPPGNRGDSIRALYGRDPDGNHIELMEFAPGTGHVYHHDRLATAEGPKSD